MRVLVAGESWTNITKLSTGADSFELSSYAEVIEPFVKALRGQSHEVTYMPSHLVPNDFPESEEALSSFDVVVLSDVGSNSFLLSSAVYERSEFRPNRLEVMARWVRNGGGLLMIGGYLSFNGIEGKARFGGTALEEVLPVTCIPGDDRVEAPSGGVPVVLLPDHPVLVGVPEEWPWLLGWNRTSLRANDAQLLASVESDQTDPLLAVREIGSGRTAAFTSDCSPHWAPDAFLDWPGYATLWSNLVAWLGAGLP